MKPKISYTIWFSQRNGSSLLCEGLKATGIAGRPGELLQIRECTSLLEFYQVKDYSTLQSKLWQAGMTPNGVFGLKANAPKKENDPLMQELAQIVEINPAGRTHYAVWENVFPNGKHIFLTRRNKIRQVVSWWKAIVTDQWHLTKGQERKPSGNELNEQYNFEALKFLLLETALRESKIQAFLEEGNIIPLTLVYEDFVKEYEKTIRSVIAFLGITETDYPIEKPYYEQLSDDMSEEWVERFRKELQKDWNKIIW